MYVFLVRENGIDFLDYTENSVNSSTRWKRLGLHPDRFKGLVVNNLYLYRRFGMRLSQEQVDLFFLHRSVWLYISQMDDEKSLILSESVSLKCNLVDVQKYIIDANDNYWDILFPFDKSDKLKRVKAVGPYLLGGYWGADIYIMHRETAGKLLKKAELRQDLGDELLSLAKSGNIDIYTDEQVKLVHLDEDCCEIPIKTKHSLYSGLISSDVMNKRDRKIMRKLLKALSSVSKHRDLHLCLFGGSLLGYVRHGQRMLWDDDVDLSIDLSECEDLLQGLSLYSDLTIARYERKKSKITKNSWYYYKIWCKSGRNITGFEHTFPFVDIWIFENKMGGATYLGGEFFRSEIYYPLSLGDFEGFTFAIPADPLKVLDQHIPAWDKKIFRDPFCHKRERFEHFPLQLDIVCDKNGRMIGLR